MSFAAPASARRRLRCSINGIPPHSRVALSRPIREDWPPARSTPVQVANDTLAPDGCEMPDQAGLPLLQAVTGRLPSQLAGDDGHQGVQVRIGLQQRAQRDAKLTEQTQAQVAAGRDTQAVAIGAEVLRIRSDETDAATVVRVRILAGRSGIGGSGAP